MPPMTSQALAGVLAGTTLALLAALIALAIVYRGDRAFHERERGRILERATDDLNRARARTDHDLEGLRRRIVELEALRIRAQHAERRVEELELELGRRRAGPILEGETVALTTPGERTIRGVVRQTFDNGAVLLGGATVYVERRGRGGEIEVEELDAGDVVVPAHRWAQKLPPASTQED